jgi:hypothetical protein
LTPVNRVIRVERGDEYRAEMIGNKARIEYTNPTTTP